jgi:acyl-CoA synthetase (AMP-forming)/AMP-acid ligase II
MNLVESILYQSKLTPFATAIATPGSGINSIKYGQLEKLIHNVARSAIKAGLAPGEVAALSISDAILHAVIIFGLMRIGVVTMSLAEPSLPDGIAVNAVVTDVPQLFSSAGNVLAVNAAWLGGDGTPLDYERVYHCRDEDTCCINLTSGSTGRRKGIALSHAMLAGRVAYYGYSKGRSFAHMSRLYCGFGIPTTPGYTYMLYVLSHGGTIYFSGSDVTAFLQYIAPYRVQGMVTSPYNLEGLLKFFEADPALECTFEVIICQGARLSAELSQRVRSRMCQNLFTSYGSTETATCVFGPAEITGKIPGAVGFVCPGYGVDVVDPDGRALPTGREGSVRIRSPYSANGYLGDPETSAQMFRDGAFYIGDRGYVTAEGMLVITGREKTALLISGDSIAPEIIEEVLCGFAGIDQAAVCTVDDALGIARIHALIIARPEIDESELRAHCESKLRKVFVPESFIRTDGIPRGGQGKIDRQRVVELATASLKRA